MPGYHTPGLDHFVHASRIDPVSFDEKLDKVVWRGNLTGRPVEALVPGLTMPRPSQAILKHLGTIADSDPAMKSIEEQLKGITRFRVVKTFWSNSDFDLGFVIPDKHSKAKATSLISRYCLPRELSQFFFRFRYILSLSGHDTGSNFLMAANSNSVVLKEEDNWEVYYSGVFLPWEHYVPLELGATDLEEKLEWARQNPRRCKEISMASSSICRELANRMNRSEYLKRIFEDHAGRI